MWIKVCGITRLSDAVDAVVAGVDAIGLNFYQGSRRYVSPETAARICHAVRNSSAATEIQNRDVGQMRSAEPGRHRLSDSDSPVDLVGLFVNMPVPQAIDCVNQSGVTAVQFHGEETVEDLQEFHRRLPHLPMIRALRINSRNLPQAMDQWHRLAESLPELVCLLDALVEGQYGGTGCTLHPDDVATFRDRFPHVQLVIAGGLTSDNVAAAIRQFGPWGIDTASGVEVSAGCKSPEKVRSLVRAVRFPA